ncbi:uncharacterized protein LOC128205096 isoform X2 [Mya arenaria]|uniref:uncharacterized protein LOC128205096 isoform X2 n=1 Tax=Mya arenaria TaxID=6604 RepID=UPI0022DEEA96|nr:uncharacterized protein LOC128205096 isoform X2 [Mya arenaria]
MVVKVLIAVLHSNPMMWRTSTIMIRLPYCLVYLRLFKYNSCQQLISGGCNHVKDTPELKLHLEHQTQVVSKFSLKWPYDKLCDVLELYQQKHINIIEWLYKRFPFAGSLPITKSACALLSITGGYLARNTYDGGYKPFEADHTITKIVWEVPSKRFPTFGYTFVDICELVASIRGHYIILGLSTDTLESLCSNIDVMANNVKVVFLLTTTKQECRILETIVRLFESENIIQTSNEHTSLKNLKEENKMDPFFIISTCNTDIIHYFRQDEILSRIIFLSDHGLQEKYARNQVTLQHTTLANFLDKVDDLLESYFLRMFAQIIKHYIHDCEDDEQTTETVRFANAIYQRSGLPEDERPNFNIGKISLHSKKVPMKIKHEIVEIDQVLGCGEEGGVLTIDINKKGCNRDEAKRMVTEVLKRHGIEKYHIYFSEIETHAKVEIKSGEACNMNDRYGTLGPFMIEDLEDQQQGRRAALSVVCAGHVVEKDNNAFLQAQNKNIGKVSCKYDGTGMDIAKVRVEEDMLTFIDVRFCNEAGEKMIVKLNDKDSSDSLLGRRVFLRGASTQLGLGIISSSEYISRDKCRILKIRKRENDSSYAENGDSGATVLSLERKGKHLEAFGIHLSQLCRDGSIEAYQALYLKDGLNYIMSRDAGLPLRLASSCEVEPHIHFEKVTVAVVEITRKYIRGVQATDAHITENICSNVKELELLSDNLKPGEIVDQTLAFIQPIWGDGLHSLVVIVTDVIDKATPLRMNASECLRMTQREAIEYSCTITDKQIHVLLNVDDSKIYYFTSSSSQQLPKNDTFDINNIIQSNCLEKLKKRYKFEENDQEDNEKKNVVEQFKKKLTTFDGDTDIHISVLDPCNVNVENDNKIIITKGVVIDILKTVCKEIEDKVLAAFTTHGLTGNAVVHVYGVLTNCPKLQKMLPDTFGQKITKCMCVMELPKQVLHKAASKRLKCNCALGIQGMPKPLCYRPWK